MGKTLAIETIRWGILGTGNIARQFATGLSVLTDATLLAVGSRTQASANAFGDQFGVRDRHGSYEELANNPEVDAIYISTPHPLHHDNCLLCLNAGKAVLCEKPFAINAAEAAEMVALARAKGLFLMEAMWTRFVPSHQRLGELVAEGAIGEPQLLEADFGFFTPFDAQSRLFDPALGGGALLDVGVYPVSLASRIFGEPERVTSSARIGVTGVDEVFAAQLGYSDGRAALVMAATRAAMPQRATLSGTAGKITLPRPWWRGTRMELARHGQRSELLVFPLDGNGYNYEAAEVGHCLRDGRTESTVMPLDETLAIMRTLDAIREPWGLRYPMEQQHS